MWFILLYFVSLCCSVYCLNNSIWEWVKEKDFLHFVLIFFWGVCIWANFDNLVKVARSLQ